MIKIKFYCGMEVTILLTQQSRLAWVARAYIEVYGEYTLIRNHVCRSLICKHLLVCTMLKQTEHYVRTCPKLTVDYFFT